jgi:hypothetical protein
MPEHTVQLAIFEHVGACHRPLPRHSLLGYDCQMEYEPI